MTTTEDIQHSDLIDWTIFSELLLMDEDEEGFSKGLITTFVDQALGIYDEIETIIEESKDKTPEDDQLTKLSSLGHYLKGSAALLGLKKIQYQCERIQNYGNKLNDKDDIKIENGSTNNEEWLNLIKDALNISKLEFENTKKVLSDYFGEQL